LIEHLNLTNNVKSTLSGDKPFHTSMTRSEENKDLTVHEQRRLKMLYGCSLATDAVLIPNKLVKFTSVCQPKNYFITVD